MVLNQDLDQRRSPVLIEQSAEEALVPPRTQMTACAGSAARCQMPSLSRLRKGVKGSPTSVSGNAANHSRPETIPKMSRELHPIFRRGNLLVGCEHGQKEQGLVGCPTQSGFRPLLPALASKRRKGLDVGVGISRQSLTLTSTSREAMAATRH